MKRTISLLMAALMILSFVPSRAFAESAQGSPDEKMEIFRYGTYDNLPLYPGDTDVLYKCFDKDGSGDVFPDWTLTGNTSSETSIEALDDGSGYCYVTVGLDERAETLVLTAISRTDPARWNEIEIPVKQTKIVDTAELYLSPEDVAEYFNGSYSEREASIGIYESMVLYSGDSHIDRLNSGLLVPGSAGYYIAISSNEHNVGGRMDQKTDPVSSYRYCCCLKVNTGYAWLEDPAQIRVIFNGRPVEVERPRLSGDGDRYFNVYLDLPSDPASDGAREISFIDIEADLPNDGEAYISGADEAALSRLKTGTAGVEILSADTVMFGKKVSGTANAGDVYGLSVKCAAEKGYVFSEGCAAVINGSQADAVKTGDTVAVGTQNGGAISVTYNAGITITGDLPEEILHFPGDDITVSVSAEGDGLRYAWILTDPSREGAKVKFSSGNTIQDSSSSSLTIEAADESYIGKKLRCRIYNQEGNAYSSCALIKEKHVYEMNHDAEFHWEECACGDIINKDQHTGGTPVVVKKPGPDEEGLAELICRVCGAEYEVMMPKTPGSAAESTEEQTGQGPQEQTGQGHEETTGQGGGAAQEELTTPFVDVPEDAYYYDATVWAFSAKPQITDGNGKDKFMPEQICSRGQVVTFLWRSAGQPAPAKTVNPFEDVKESDYFYQPVLWAFYNDTQITDGTDPAHFSPGNNCRNSHILTFIYRAMGEPDKTGEGTWYTDACNWAKYEANLLEGTFEGTYDINAYCPRKNVVQYLYRYYVMSGK